MPEPSVNSPRVAHPASPGHQGFVLASQGSYEDRMNQLRRHVTGVQKRMKSLEERRQSRDQRMAAIWAQHQADQKEQRRNEVKRRLEDLQKRHERREEQRRLQGRSASKDDESEDLEDLQGYTPLDEQCTAQEVLQMADRHSANRRLSVSEMQTFLQNTKYEGFMKWITTQKNWSTLDRNRSGAIELDELTTAIERYKENVPPTETAPMEAAASLQQVESPTAAAADQPGFRTEIPLPSPKASSRRSPRRRKMLREQGVKESIMQEAQERFLGLYRSTAGRAILDGAPTQQRSYRAALARRDPAAIARAEADTPTQELEGADDEASSIAEEPPASHRSIARRYRLRMIHSLCREVSVCKRQISPGGAILPPLPPTPRHHGEVSSPLVAPLPKALVSA